MQTAVTGEHLNDREQDEYATHPVSAQKVL